MGTIKYVLVSTAAGHWGNLATIKADGHVANGFWLRLYCRFCHCTTQVETWVTRKAKVSFCTQKLVLTLVNGWFWTTQQGKERAEMVTPLISTNFSTRDERTKGDQQDWGSSHTKIKTTAAHLDCISDSYTKQSPHNIITVPMGGIHKQDLDQKDTGGLPSCVYILKWSHLPYSAFSTSKLSPGSYQFTLQR